MTFLSLNALERAHAICPDFFAQGGVAEHASLTFGVGSIEGKKCYLLAQDARYEGGSFGVAESDAVAHWLDTIVAQPAPIIFVLDSGGARMSEGLAALGGFRRLFRAAADAWLANIPMLFVCGKTVFGGASMLASLGDQRVFFERSLYGMSGPRIVEAVAGATDFDASDKALVVSVMGGAARAKRRANTRVADDENAVRAACTSWVSALPKTDASDQTNALQRLQAKLIAQRQQLEADELTRAPNPLPAHTPLLQGTRVRAAWMDAGVLLGRTQDDGFLYGIVDGKWADSWDAWKLSNALLSQAETSPQAAVTVLLDCPAHASSRALEAGMISQYFTLLGLALRYLHAAGAMVTLHIVGDAAGGVHVALAGGASRVLAYPSASIRILPRIAINQVRPDALETEVDENDWLERGVADTLARL